MLQANKEISKYGGRVMLCVIRLSFPLFFSTSMQLLVWPNLEVQKRPQTADMPIGKEESTHGPKKLKSKQKRLTERGSMLPREPEDQASRAHTN